MVYLLGTDIADKPAGVRFRDLLDRPGILQMPGTHNGMAALQARDAGFSALYLSGAAMTASMGLPDLGIITIEEVCVLHPPGGARRRPAGAGRWRHRLWRSAQCHEHGAHLRGCRRCGRSHRGSAASEKMRPSQRQEAGGCARHGGQGRRRRQGATSSLPDRQNGCRGQRRHGRRGSACETLSGSGSGRDLPGSDDFARDVRGVRQARSRRSAAGEHDGVRQDAVLHRVRVRGRWAIAW